MIAVDTAVAHLAGALGKPVWILISHIQDWRWFLGRDDSPWYPSARLFRQPKPGDWDGVVAEIAAELGDFAKTRRSAQARRAPIFRPIGLPCRDHGLATDPSRTAAAAAALPADPAAGGYGRLCRAAASRAGRGRRRRRAAAAEERETKRTLINRAKTLAPVVQGAGAALLLDGHADLVARAGADGVHLTGLDDFEDTLERLKPERIVGLGGLASRHECMVAAERGADYVLFGRPDADGRRPPFEAIEERVNWWAELFELPCVAYADNLDEIAPLVAAGADFVALGDWLWRDEAAIAATLQTASAHLQLPEAIA